MNNENFTILENFQNILSENVNFENFRSIYKRGYETEASHASLPSKNILILGELL